MTMYQEKTRIKESMDIRKKQSPLRVVSVSLGSSSRNKIIKTTLLNQEIIIERIGTDANFNKALKLIKELDGKVDAIGLGGINLFLSFFDKKFTVREAKILRNAAKLTPVVDGFGLKQTIEPLVIRSLQNNGIVNFKNKNVLMVSALDRGGMALEIYNMETNDRYGDLTFGLRIPYLFSKKDNINLLKFLANLFLPIICMLPYNLLYPMGRKQENTVSRYHYLFDWADIIVGDFHYIRRYSPDNMEGKIVITSTTTADDVQMLRNKGVDLLVTTTPCFDGRSFGTNLMEAVLVALSDNKSANLSENDYLELINKLNWSPNITFLQENNDSKDINLTS